MDIGHKQNYLRLPINKIYYLIIKYLAKLIIMKTLKLLFCFLIISISIQAQVVEHLYDFNDLNVADLNGQDDWVTIPHTTGTADLIVDFVAGSVVPPDGTQAVFYNAGGPGVGRTATRKATANFDFDFTQAGIIEMEIDMHQAWWGTFFGAGYDADGDGHIAPGLSTEPDDGGIYFNVAGVTGNDKIILPNGENIEFIVENDGWCRYKMILDFTANDGEGAVGMYYDPGVTGEWIAISEVQGVNMGLTPGSGDKRDRAVWDGIFFHSQGSLGGFDNIIIRQPENLGQLQFIEFIPVPNKLTTDPPFDLEAFATSGLPVEFEIIEGPATLEGVTVTLTGEAGFVTIKASQPGDDTWAPAPDIFQTFEVVDPQAYTADLTIRRPANDSKVYMAEISEIMLVASAYIEHDDVLHIENVEFEISGQSMGAKKWFTGYNTYQWTPPDYGNYTMTVNVTTTGNVLTTNTVNFEVTQDIIELSVPAFEGVELNFGHQTDTAEFVFPTYAGAFNQIISFLNVSCPPGGCEPWDRVGYLEVRGPTGEWVELFRYITPYGVPCEHNLDVTDYASLLQGLVEMRIHMGIWQNGLVIDMNFDFQAGEPDYKYSWVDVIWRGTYSFGDYANLQPMDTIIWNYTENAEASRLKIINSGHGWGDLNTGNAAEFYEATHKIKVNEDDSFDQHLWVVCNPNPDGCQPQNGTWYHNRAGWCPGSISFVYDYDMSPYVYMSDVEIVYEFYPGYVDYCHPNHPDCVTGVTCSDCSSGFNPHYIISGNLVTYSNEQIISGIENPSFDEIGEITISPNPNNGVSVLSVTGEKIINNASVSIFNNTGQLIKEFLWDGSPLTLNMSAYKKGLYFVKIHNAGKAKSMKLIVN